MANPFQRQNGLPGLVQQTDAAPPPQVQEQLLTRSEGEQVIGRDEILRAAEILAEYKQGKVNLEERIVQDELWWELRHWEVVRNRRRAMPHDPNKYAIPTPEPSSAWLFNAIVNKHADAMDNMPEHVVLPREASDEESAKVLSEVLPVIMEQCEFEQVYSDNWWDKLKHGTAAYGVFWDSSAENGLGDISVRGIDLLKLFWEPGVTDIQKSRNLFIVELVDTDLLEEQYPEHRGKLAGAAVDVKQYIYDDTVDTSDKSVVVDWYYKVKAASGQTLLHYCKFVNDCVLYASENDAAYRERGYYDHGMYPVVLDVMFPEKGTPCGFGYVAICKDPQLYIDKLSANILETSMMATKKRYFVSESTNVNEQEFLDWNKPIVHVAGEISDKRIQEIAHNELDDLYVTILQMKQEEMKDTAANRDVNSGGTGSGVTAAAAISALQEAGNKASRDMIEASYRAYTGIGRLVVELIRQFYDEERSFRIVAPNGSGYQFVGLSNAGLRDQAMGVDSAGVELYRRPIFDLKIKAQKTNPFSRMEQNERAKELYSLGFFSPERAQEAMGALEMMEFEGIDKVREQVQQGQTLYNMVQQMDAQMQQMAALLQQLTGQSVGQPAQQQSAKSSGGGSMPTGSKGTNATSGIMQAHTPMTDYGTRLAENSKPSMASGS
ncbi:MAG: hypothetical protein LUF80_00575 [Oscillospiraceae bacterium]|nr:hypothetical protein [Oscillospiraceae bacterium]